MNEPDIDEHNADFYKTVAKAEEMIESKRLDSQPVPVEPKTGVLYGDLVVLKSDYDTLQSELKRVTEERDKWKSEADGQFKYAGQLLDQLHAAESRNRRMVELLLPLTKIADTNGAGWSEDEVNAMAKGIKAMSAELLKEVRE